MTIDQKRVAIASAVRKANPDKFAASCQCPGCALTVTLADVLLALGHREITATTGGRLIVFWKGKMRLFDWKLAQDDLNEQFSETVDFLYLALPASAD